MKNSESSAFPLINESCGLTKKEYISALALQGILANPNFNGGESLMTFPEKCESAIAHADELLRKLNTI